MAIKKITHVEAYDMSNTELINCAIDLTYTVGELKNESDVFDFAANMSTLLVEIKWRAIQGKFSVKSPIAEG